MPVGATISPLNLSDTFQTWFNRTNTLITDVNTIDITGITPSSAHEDGLTFDFSGSNVQIGFLGVTNMTQDIVFGGNVTFSNIPEGQFVHTVNGSTGNVTITVTGVATLGSSAGSVPVYSSSENQYTGVQVYPGQLSEVDHVFGVLGSFTSGFSGGSTTEYSNFVQYATGGGAVFGLAQSGGSGGDITADYESNAQFGEVELYGFTGAQVGLFQQHSAYGISGHAAKTGGFYIRYGDIGGGAASNMGVLFRSGNTLGVQGTPLIALNLEKDTVALGSTSSLAADGFFSLISPSGDFNRNYNPLTILGDGQTFAIRHGKAEEILDIREFGDASPGSVFEYSGASNTGANNTSIQGYGITGNVIDRISGKAGGNIGVEIRGTEGSFSVMTNLGVSAGTGDDSQTDTDPIQRIAMNIDRKGNVVIGGKEIEDGLIGGPTGHQSYYLGLAAGDAPWGHTAGYSAGAEKVVDTQAFLDTYPEHQYGVTFEGYPDGFGSLNIVSGRLHIKGSAGNTQAFLDGKKQYLFTDGVSCEWRTQDDSTSSTIVSNFSNADSDPGEPLERDLNDGVDFGSAYAGYKTPTGVAASSCRLKGTRGTLQCQDGDGNYITGRAMIRLRIGAEAIPGGNGDNRRTLFGCGMFVSVDKGSNFVYVDGTGTDSSLAAETEYGNGRMTGAEAIPIDEQFNLDNQRQAGFNFTGQHAQKMGMANSTPQREGEGPPNQSASTANLNLMHAVNVPANGGLVIKFDIYGYNVGNFANDTAVNSEMRPSSIDVNARAVVEFQGSDF